MKLKPQPPGRAPQRRARRRRGAASHGRPRRAAAGRAAPASPLRQRLAGRLPSIRRLLAGTGAVAAAAGLVALLNGPWLRVTRGRLGGRAYTPTPRTLDRLLDRRRRDAACWRSTPRALRERIEALPSVAEAAVTAQPRRRRVDGRRSSSASVAFVWETRSARFLGAADGTMFAALAAATPSCPAAWPALPRIDRRAPRRRGSSRVGDRDPRGARCAPRCGIAGHRPGGARLVDAARLAVAPRRRVRLPPRRRTIRAGRSRSACTAPIRARPRPRRPRGWSAR